MEQSLPSVGSHAPEFSLSDHQGTPVTLQSLRGTWAVLYFYPKDNTSGCTMEAVEFSALLEQFQQLNARVLGISPDSVKSHCKFRESKSLTVTLLSDPNSEVLSRYGAWKQKSMYGREYMGVERSTVLVAPDGMVAFHWAKVKAAGHAQQVLEKLRELSTRS